MLSNIILGGKVPWGPREMGRVEVLEPGASSLSLLSSSGYDCLPPVKVSADTMDYSINASTGWILLVT